MSAFDPTTRHGLSAEQLDDLAKCANLLTRFKAPIAAVLADDAFRRAEEQATVPPQGQDALSQTRRAIDWLLLERPE